MKEKLVEQFIGNLPISLDIKPMEAPPFPSVPSYDAKAWPFIKEYGKQNALFWNVGA